MQVTFRLKCAKTQWGQNLAVTGSNASVGMWDFKGSALLTTDANMFPKWESKPVTMQPQELEYKYIMYDEHGNVNWETAGNRKVDLRSIKGKTVIVEDEAWNQMHSQAAVISESAGVVSLE